MRLAQFQAQFAAALHAAQLAPAQHAGLRVYRNTVMKGCIDALRANFPTVERLTGAQWFEGVAALYARRHPPVHPSLLYYGEGLPEFLSALDSLEDLPYLPDVARLDQMWLRAHTAADELALSAEQLDGLAPSRLAGLRVRAHASAQWAWFELAPAFTIWDANRRGTEVPVALQWRAEGGLLVRSAGAVQWQHIDHATHRFLEACRSGRTLAEAALECGAAADAARGFAALLVAGAFAVDEIR